MMRGGTIIVTLFLSKVFLKNKAEKHQIIGSIFAFFGVFIVGLSNVLFSDSSTGSS
jgi:drug/metabolite transporter (DMT)-like permease